MFALGGTATSRREGVERVLHDGSCHRVQLDEAGARLLVGLEVAAELEPEVRLPERDMAAPADAAVGGSVCAAEVLNRFE